MDTRYSKTSIYQWRRDNLSERTVVLMSRKKTMPISELLKDEAS